MPDIAQGNTAKLILAPGEVYRVSAAGTATVQAVYGAPSGTTTVTSSSRDFGPYDAHAKLVVTATSGQVNYQLRQGMSPVLVDDDGRLLTPSGEVVGGGVGVDQFNLVVNGDMSSGITGWVGVRSNISAASNVLTVAGTSGYPGSYKTFPTVAGRRYRLSCNIPSVGGTTINVGVADQAAGGTDIMRQTITAAGSVSVDFVALSGVSAAWILAQNAGTPTFSISDLACYEVAATARDVIIDTDLDSDCDDVAALDLACRLHKRGWINIKAVTIASSTLYAAPCARAVLNFHGLSTVPVGAYKGSALTATSAYNQAVAAAFGSSTQTRRDFINATSLLRSVLAEALPGSITMCCIGPMTNVSALISSTADNISTQTGLALINSKVRQIVAVGGDYTSGTEFNFAADAAAAAALFTNVTSVPIFSVGFTVGNSIFCAPPATATTTNSPVKLAYSLFSGGVTTRQSWDPLAVSFAALGASIGIGYGGTNGTNTVNSSTGANTWSATAGNCSYASIATGAASVGAVLNYLLAQ